MLGRKKDEKIHIRKRPWQVGDQTFCGKYEVNEVPTIDKGGLKGAWGNDPDWRADVCDKCVKAAKR